MASLLALQAKRYSSKGIPSLLLAVLITVFFTVLLPQLARAHWASFIALADVRALSFIVPQLMHSVAVICTHLALAPAYSGKCWRQYKISPHPWPWESQPEAWRALVRKAIGQGLFNALVLVPLFGAIEYNLLECTVRYDVESFPGTQEILLHTVVCMLIEDFWFYWGHRALHHPALYGRFHKLHHEFRQPTVLAAHHFHPVEFVGVSLIGLMLGPTLLGRRMHLFTKLFWMLIRVGEAMDGHCGFELPWSPFRLLPFSNSSEYHDWHHTRNQGNFGSWFNWWDTLCGTRGQLELKRKKDD